MTQAKKKAGRKAAPTEKTKAPSQRALREAYAQQAIHHPKQSFSDRHYVFIAKAKRGEVWALNGLKLPSKAHVTPLFEMWPPKQIVKKGTTPKTLLEHTRDVLGIVAKEWKNLPCFLDTRYITTGKNQPASASAVPVIFGEARQQSIDCVPVTFLNAPPAFQQAIAAVVAQDKRGLLVRLRTGDLADATALQGYMAGLLAVMKLTASDIDILID